MRPARYFSIIQLSNSRVVGDRLYTDIAVAEGSSVTSILVLSGESTMEDVEKSANKPDFIYRDLSEIPL